MWGIPAGSPPDSSSIRTVSSMNSGLPSVVPSTASRCSGDSSADSLSASASTRVALSSRGSASSSIAVARTLAAAPGRALVEQVCAREAEDQQGNVLDPAREVLDQVEHRLLGPVDVLEHEHERLQVGELRRPRLRRPGDLRRRALATDRVENAGRQREEIRDGLVAAAVPELLGCGVDESSSVMPAATFTISATAQ